MSESHSLLDSEDLSALKYIVTHVFCPLQLPGSDDHSVRNDHSLAAAITAAARLYRDHVCPVVLPHWQRIVQLLDNLSAIVHTKSLDISKITSQIGGMRNEDVIVFLIRAQNAAVMFQRQQDATIFESFEVSPKAENVMAAQGKLICSYPGPVIKVPNDVFDNEGFRSELVNFLVHVNDHDAATLIKQAQSGTSEIRDPSLLRCITELLTGILRSVGSPATDVVRISKRVGDDVVSSGWATPWRRSSLWLLIRVTLQTLLYRYTGTHDTYKTFMLFFMCCLAREKMSADLPNDYLQVMSAKISRRLRKLGCTSSENLSPPTCSIPKSQKLSQLTEIVLQTCTSLRFILDERWGGIQAAQRASPVWAPSQLDLTRDTRLSLPKSGDYIRNSLSNRGVNSIDASFNPKHHRRGTLETLLSSDGAFFDDAYRLEPHITLYDVERAVEGGIDDWINQVTDRDDACVRLEILANKYSSSARKTYEKNPELLSVMLLTTIELWIALDKIAIKAIPMLADYSPEIPSSLLEHLLFSKSTGLDRLQLAHQYLCSRHSLCKSKWSVFSHAITKDSFAVRFFQESSDLKGLKSRIEEDAHLEVQEKVAELKKANAAHAKLQQEMNLARHQYITGGDQHDPNCVKCSLTAECRSMKIDVHEWPLPADEVLAEAVVFELDCPVSFSMWRTATCHLLVDVCSPPIETTYFFMLLSGYKALQRYSVQHTRSQVTLATDTRPFTTAHYSQSSIPTTQEHVCVNNGLSFYGHYTNAKIPVWTVLDKVDISKCCKYELPSGPYKNLQKYLDATSHLSNNVVANQADCHRDISIHEFMAFAHLRSGGLLQWLNVLRELRGRSLTFHRPEVHYLLAQAVSQVGPLENSGCLTWHQEIQQPSFCRALLRELDDLVQDVKTNWLKGVTMDTISFLLRRLLASSHDDAIVLRAVELLRTVRREVFSWVQELSSKLVQTSGDEEIRGTLRDTAAICRSTFAVDPIMIPKLLHSAEDIEVLVCSAIFIHDNTPSKVSGLSAYSQLLLDRDRGLSLALESTLSNAIRTDSGNQGIADAVHKAWPEYQPGSKWAALEEPYSHWFSCTTAQTAQQRSQEVHYNVLDGSLLVDKKPLGRLPSEIFQHPVYTLIFGEKVFDVIPSNLPGMNYSTRVKISDHYVHFALVKEDLVIQARRAATENPDVFELIPQKKLEGDLPTVLVKGHVHWLNLSTSIMEIRPHKSLWESSSENWRIYCTLGKYRMRRGNELLVDVHSKSWGMISALLKPIELSQNLIVTAAADSTHLSSSQLSVALPRYGLSFYVDKNGDLQSHNMRGMVYDQDQSIGTLFGLVNQLVLRPKAKDAHPVDLIPRCVLIPEGKISFKKSDHHVRVEVDINSPTLQRVAYQMYRVDTDLGCLTGNVSLTNKLYRVYLHALTSGCGPDPLTGRSGTEEALSLLRSADCWSITKFTARDVELLKLIASIYPERKSGWHGNSQRVQWLDLPVNSQHHEFYVVSNAIKVHYEKIQLFHENPPSDLFEKFPSCNSHFLERNARRTAHLFPSQLFGKPSEETLDAQYPPTRVAEDHSGEHRAYTVATAVYKQNARVAVTTDILSMAESWKGSISGDTSLSLHYDKLWLISNLQLMWIKAYNLLRSTTESDKEKRFQLLFSLPAIVYASPELANLVPVFLAFAFHPKFHSEQPPSYDSYNISDGYSPSPEVLRGYVTDYARTFENSPESSEHVGDEDELPDDRSEDDVKKRQLDTYRNRIDSDADAAVARMLGSWPCETLQVPFCSLNEDLYDLEALASHVQNRFSSCYRNLKLKEHFARVQVILNELPPPSALVLDGQYSFRPSESAVPSSTTWSLTADQLFARPAPSVRPHDRLPRYHADVANLSLSGSAKLRQLITVADANAAHPFQRLYISGLRSSAKCLGSETSVTSEETKLPTTEKLLSHYTQCKDRFIEGLRDLKQCLGPTSQSEQAVQQSGQWPRITTRVLLQSLASNSGIELSEDWKKCLTTLALIALELQRARRLLRLHFGNLREEFRRELENEGCDGWTAEAYPDWLLIQLQGNFMVRHVQAAVAGEMISPKSGENTAMQLNMGEGKSSVIVPIVVAALADGKQLVRVIIPKALAMQMFQVLVDRLAGLTNRPIFFLPFSRSLKIDQNKMTALHELVSKCMKERGILVVQPEHILSLKLVSVEKQLLQKDNTKLAGALLEFQKWLHSHSRDILDESDEVLHVRYQLAYTVGIQQHMEGFPERWTTTQQILNLVNKHSSSIQERFRHGVEYERGPSGSFPHLRILHAGAGKELIARIVQDVLNGRLTNFGFGPLRSELERAIRSFISCVEVSPAKVQLVKDYSRKTSLWARLLHLRGLLANGILLFALGERRWRVNYGLSPTRTMLAVPYRAKDVPAQRAEFGHPDISIILTCLSYYYGGLTENQLTISFEILLQQADPSLDYDLWVKNCHDLPKPLRTLSGINIKSTEQWKDYLFPLFSKNQATIDFYLSQVVFPKEAKEFPLRLSCSGWDLAEKKELVLTGFSGTNDGQYLLPLHITQRDPDHQRQTNAKVLLYLLKPENNHYMCMSHKNGERKSTREFLKILVAQNPPIRVLLDVGAQMLDLQNSELAEAWLEINTDASAAIYFNENDELTVRTRDGTIQLLLSSPFAQQLDQCVVYFDDAHTRGIDVKFPKGSRAAVTLGPKVTKDRLTQGCMRMRKLGHGHSVMFFAPLEIDRRIRSLVEKNQRDRINTVDILHWAIRETCDDIQRRAPLWAQQGMDHTTRYSFWSRFCAGNLDTEALSQKWVQPGAKTLKDLYEPYSTSDDSDSLVSSDFRRRCVELGVSVLQDVNMDEEEERELTHEAENERQAERPPVMPPEIHANVHEDIIAFIMTGNIPMGSKAFRPAFDTLDATSAVTDEAHIWSPNLLATTDFEKTVKTSGKLDEYLRPVQWVVSGKRANKEVLVIMSPHEINQFLPYFRSSTHVRLHLYTPRISKSLKPCDDLTFYTIPSLTTEWAPLPHLIDQLNLFAGQLYLKDHETYLRLCRFLCVYASDLRGQEGSIEVGCDGFIAPSSRPSRLQSASAFQKSPLGSLKTLTNLRRKGMRFTPTHMGCLLEGRLVPEQDFKED